MSLSQRRFFRVPVRLPGILVVAGREPLRATVADLSLEGLSVIFSTDDEEMAARVRRLTPSETLVNVAVTLAGTPVVLPGRVTWSRAAARDVGFGVKLELDGPTRRVFRGWMVKALSALQSTARHAMHSEWDDAADSLGMLGIDDATQPIVSHVLAYAAGSGAAATRK